MELRQLRERPHTGARWRVWRPRGRDGIRYTEATRALQLGSARRGRRMGTAHRMDAPPAEIEDDGVPFRPRVVSEQKTPEIDEDPIRPKQRGGNA
jgi:hypothetical protein